MMEIGFQRGTWLAQYSKVSTIKRMEGSGGKIQDFCAMYSLRMSFWMVPPICFLVTPCFSATAIYMESSTDAGPLMVMEVVTLSSGMPSKMVSMSLSVSTATPHTAHFAPAQGVVGVEAI